MADNEQIPDGAQPPAGQPHLGPTNNTAGADLPDEFDVEVTDAPADGEEAPVAEPKPAAAKPAEPKRPRGDPERRIGQAVARQREAETMAERLDRENRELMAEFETKDKATQTATARADAAERAAFLHHSTNVANETKLANIEYRQAVEAGDPDKQAAANQKIARLAVQQNEIDNWKATHPDPTPGARPAAETEPERQRQPVKPATEQPAEPAPMRSPDAKVQGWLDENPWFDPFNTGDYDKEMHLATVHYAADLERRLKASGRAAEINSDQYWGKVTNYLRTEFPERFDGADPSDNPDVIVVPAVSATTTPPSRNARQVAPNPRMPVMSKPNSVLPANGQQAPGAKPTQRLQVQMSPDEKEMAIKQWEAGAMGNHHKTGKPIATAAEAVDQLAWRKGRIALGRS